MICGQFPTLNCGLLHSGSQPFNINVGRSKYLVSHGSMDEHRIQLHNLDNIWVELEAYPLALVLDLVQGHDEPLP